ncbi:MAG: hypothetical protein PUC12_14690 [Clostridiales bacterium]|nr:hypothetical protein [Clostridiales bacterium]
MKNGFKKKIVVLVLIGLSFYLLMGQEWINLQRDSATYTEPSGGTGVMPIYPMFIFLMKCIFGVEHYLNAVVVIQSLLAVFCTLAFVLYLRNRFQLKFWEVLLMYFACMLPFSIYLPETGITHQILTEGISYSLFYIYFIALAQYVYVKKSKWLLPLIAMSMIIALTRSQLLLLIIVDVVAFWYVCFKNCMRIKLFPQIMKLFMALIGSAVAALLLVIIVYKICGLYLVMAVPMIQNYGNEVAETVNIEQTNIGEINIEERTIEEQTMEEQASGEVPSEVIVPEVKLSQFTSVILIRGLYEADEDDVLLFDMPEKKEIFQRVYKAIDEQEYRYVYAKEGLYMWEDLICERIAAMVPQILHSYLEEHPEVHIDPNAVISELGMKVLLHHFGRYLYHTFRLAIPGFISSVFFQIRRIYLLCHFITLMLYLIGIVGCVKVRKKRAEVSEFMAVIIAFLIIMVGVTNVVFIGLQRYMVYGMGIFYCGLYMILKEQVKGYRKEIWNYIHL